ncbi:hypothetical protein V8E55_006326 [Tylopilus felleus]
MFDSDNCVESRLCFRRMLFPPLVLGFTCLPPILGDGTENVSFRPIKLPRTLSHLERCSIPLNYRILGIPRFIPSSTCGLTVHMEQTVSATTIIHFAYQTALGCPILLNKRILGITPSIIYTANEFTCYSSMIHFERLVRHPPWQIAPSSHSSESFPYETIVKWPFPQHSSKLSRFSGRSETGGRSIQQAIVSRPRGCLRVERAS